MARLDSYWILSIFVLVSVASEDLIISDDNDRTAAENDVTNILDSMTPEEATDLETFNMPMENEEENDDASTKREVQDNIESLLEQGFENARAIINTRQIEFEMRENSSTRISVATAFHGRMAEPETKHLSECKALGLLETSKLIIEKYKISRKNAEDLLKSIDIPAKICKSIEDNCQIMSMRQTSASNCGSSFFNKYRTATGECNNKNHRNYGKSGIAFERLLSPDYADGVQSPRGGGLPKPRLVSFYLSKIQKQPNPKVITQMLKAWGQFLDHDMIMTPEVSHAHCCPDGRHPSRPIVDCIPIDTTGDPFYSKFNIKCLKFSRSLPFCKNCGLAKREQLNQVTAFIDGSNMYGSTFSKANKLRSRRRGQLKINNDGEKGPCSGSCLYAFLPTSSKLGESEDRDAPFSAGDVRVNEQPGLTSLHTIFMRFHNKLARKLSNLRPELSDEILYQESRRIIGALMQHITYTEFLPIVFGSYYYRKSGLYTPSYLYPYTGYNGEKYNPSINNVFGIAFRFGHSFISDMMDAKGLFPLAGNFFNSQTMTHSGRYPSYVIEGECKRESEQMDVSLAKTVINKLFTKGRDSQHGTDLMALNIMRGRDHGIPGYNHWRKFCFGKKFSSFKDLRDSRAMPSNVIDVLEKVYGGDIEKVDLFPAGLAERRVKGGFIGPTFYCLLRYQFINTKHGDRFWYENKDSGFTGNVMAALKKATLSTVLCEAADIESIQKYVMLTGAHSSNLRQPCKDIIRRYSILDSEKIKLFASAIKTL